MIIRFAKSNALNQLIRDRLQVVGTFEANFVRGVERRVRIHGRCVIVDVVTDVVDGISLGKKDVLRILRIVCCPQLVRKLINLHELLRIGFQCRSGLLLTLHRRYILINSPLIVARINEIHTDALLLRRSSPPVLMQILYHFYLVDVPQFCAHYLLVITSGRYLKNEGVEKILVIEFNKSLFLAEKLILTMEVVRAARWSSDFATIGDD